jgi:hypothetical protein
MKQNTEINEKKNLFLHEQASLDESVGRAVQLFVFVLRNGFFFFFFSGPLRNGMAFANKDIFSFCNVTG